MDSENRELLTKTRRLIAHTQDELSRLQDEIDVARATISRSQRLLSSMEPADGRDRRR